MRSYTANYLKRLQEKLIKNSNIHPETKCWEWLGQISNSGRGKMKIKDAISQDNKIISVETASYMAFIGDVPEAELVRQTCSNRLCINPDHLETFKSPMN